MRIIDWSSDVCSSDLAAGAARWRARRRTGVDRVQRLHRLHQRRRRRPAHVRVQGVARRAVDGPEVGAGDRLRRRPVPGPARGHPAGNHRPARRVMDGDPATLSHARLDALLHDLQKRAFDLYEDAALRAEANPAQAELAYAQAEAEAAPLIAQARALNEERALDRKSKRLNSSH